MNKYKFANGYTAEWPNKAINPNGVNTQEIQWTPSRPSFDDCGNQFLGEYLYAFVPKMIQPVANRMQESILYCVDTGLGPIIKIDFKPNERPRYSQMVLPMSQN